MTTATVDPPHVGPLLRTWRRRRRLSQLDLALEAGVSTRHLSFIETGRSRPSAEMVVHLAEQLAVPLRDRNGLLLAAGYAPAYGQRDLDEPAMGPVKQALDLVLEGHEPFPALAVDRHWGLVAANRALPLLLEGVAAHLLEAPVNVLRLGLHPDGLASRVLNHQEWRDHLLARLQRQADATHDLALRALHEELAGYPVARGGPPPAGLGDIVVPLRLASEDGPLAFLSTVTTFGTATDITVAELAIETFFPADATTRAWVQRWSGGA